MLIKHTKSEKKQTLDPSSETRPNHIGNFETRNRPNTLNICAVWLHVKLRSRNTLQVFQGIWCYCTYAFFQEDIYENNFFNMCSDDARTNRARIVSTESSAAWNDKNIFLKITRSFLTERNVVFCFPWLSFWYSHWSHPWKRLVKCPCSCAFAQFTLHVLVTLPIQKQTSTNPSQLSPISQHTFCHSTTHQKRVHSTNSKNPS